MLYLTPERFRTMGVGSDLDGVEEWELRSILESASRMVDSYCNVPLLPSRYSFRGGTMTNEEHEMSYQSRRIRLRSRPILTLTTLSLYATSTQYLSVNPERVYIEDEEGWIEIVEAGLTSVGLWGAAIFPTIGLEEIIARATYTYGYRFPVEEETLTPTDALTWRAVNQFWTDDDVQVYINGVERDDDLTIDREEGTVIFDDSETAPDFDDVVTVDYTYSLPYEVARATALIAGSSVSERDLVGKGLGNLAEIAVEEVRLRRDARKSGTVVAAEAIPSAAAVLLEGLRFISVR